ncbi:MAG: chemotaxis protein CheW [Rhizobiales bacterium]|nr:chemotaxis protein CheW [Hyphomicrobiales bacterium]NRB14131.1 chemotaxis protein CheW [Hyphomicrobiales bacterium]
MDDLLSEFLTETVESLDVVDVELVRFEKDPNNKDILGNIFRLVHTIKGTCGFLGLPRLEALAHAGETLMGKYRDGAPVTTDGVTIILKSLDAIKDILAELAENEAEPVGNDDGLIAQLHILSEGKELTDASEVAASGQSKVEAAATSVKASDGEIDDSSAIKIVERELKPGEVTLDDLEAAFLSAPGPDDIETPAADTATTEDTPPPMEASPETNEATPTANNDEINSKRDKALTPQSIRVNVDTLEQLMTMVSELVLTRNQLLEILRRQGDNEFKVPLQRLSNVTAELQEGVMKTRMQPIGNAWQKLPRIIRDLANDLDKKIDLEMIGADTELDRQVLEMIKDPLTHMVRNSADHGLESTAERIAAGKSEIGKVKLSAYHEGGHIIIEIKDDGRGLNTEKIKQKILLNKLATEEELSQMTENQIHKHIFAAGFSTADVVTSVSGRGVGMDVVRTNIEVIGGNVDLVSVTGKGSTFKIKIPLTLAIVSALIVGVNDHRYAIPQLAVVELVRAHGDSEHRIEKINNSRVLRLRNKLLPLIRLDDILELERIIVPTDGEAAAEIDDNLEENGFIVVIQVGPQTFGIVVDKVFDTEEIVVKPKSALLRTIDMFSGNTILGDGSVIMIIDPNGMANHISNEMADTQAAEEEEETKKENYAEQTTSMLMFKAGGDEPKAVPLSLVTRLEEINVKDIEPSAGRDLVQYRGQLMPLLYVEGHNEMRESGRQPVLVFSDDDRSMGLVVDEILDIIETPLNIEIMVPQPGILGSALIRGQATEIMDVGYYLPQAFDDWFERREQGDKFKQKRLLLVDDSAFFRNMLSPVLSAAGYDVITAENPIEALKLLRGQDSDFDIIVSDIEMPEMDGFMFAETINNDEALKDLPIVALSSHISPGAIERGREVGFYDYVAKFDREGLVTALKETLEVKGEAA